MSTTDTPPVASSRLHVWEVTGDGTTQRVIAENEAQASQMALAARGLTAWTHPRQVQVECVPATNPESIAMVPSCFISDADRALYRQRAKAGEDVYAYSSGPGPDGTWNVWDTDTRIVLPLVEKQWRVVEAHHINQGVWQVVVTRGDERREIQFTIHPSADYHDDMYGPRYQSRAERRILDVVNHCAHFNDRDPAELEGRFV
jgi:hypothetical protein